MKVLVDISGEETDNLEKVIKSVKEDQVARIISNFTYPRYDQQNIAQDLCQVLPMEVLGRVSKISPPLQACKDIQLGLPSHPGSVQESHPF